MLIIVDLRQVSCEGMRQLKRLKAFSPFSHQDFKEVMLSAPRKLKCLLSGKLSMLPNAGNEDHALVGEARSDIRVDACETPALNPKMEFSVMWFANRHQMRTLSILNRIRKTSLQGKAKLVSSMLSMGL